MPVEVGDEGLPVAMETSGQNRGKGLGACPSLHST